MRYYMKLNMCPEFEALQTQLKSALSKERASEKRRVLACRKLGQYYARLLCIQSSVVSNTVLYPGWHLSLSFGGELSVRNQNTNEDHELKYYFKHMDECPQDLQRIVLDAMNDPELKAIYKEKDEALKDRAEARKERDALREDNDKWLVSAFLKKFPTGKCGNTYSSNMTAYTVNYKGYDIHATSYLGRLEGLAIRGPKGLMDTMEASPAKLLKMPSSNERRNVALDFYNEWLN
jgi:hypothetical protein